MSVSLSAYNQNFNSQLYNNFNNQPQQEENPAQYSESKSKDADAAGTIGLGTKDAYEVPTASIYDMGANFYYGQFVATVNNETAGSIASAAGAETAGSVASSSTSAASSSSAMA